MFGNSDYTFINFQPPHNSQCNEGVNFDGEQSSLGTVSSSTTVLFASAMGYPTPSGDACSGDYFGKQAIGFSMNDGAWRQYEIDFKPSTTYTGNVTFPLSNCNNLSFSTEACGNGSLKLYLNGKLVMDIENANLNADVPMTPGGNVSVGGFITSFAADGTTRCTVFSSTGGGTCPGTQPGTGGPQPFNRYVDDVIILKK
jgi:hypothetical protein